MYQPYALRQQHWREAILRRRGRARLGICLMSWNRIYWRRKQTNSNHGEEEEEAEGEGEGEGEQEETCWLLAHLSYTGMQGARSAIFRGVFLGAGHCQGGRGFGKF